MKFTKKILAALLCALMVVSVLPMSVMAADTEEQATKTGYLWDFESKAIGSKLATSDFDGKVEGITWGGEGNAVASKWETIADPEDASNIVLSPNFLRQHIEGEKGTYTKNDYHANGINFKSNGNMDGHIVEFSYDFYLTARGNGYNDIPLLRVYYTLNGASKNQTLVALSELSSSDRTKEVAPGTATAATSMGKLQLGTTVTKTEFFALRWYNVRMLLDTVSGLLTCYLDGELVGFANLSGWDPETCKLNYLIAFRCYDADHAATAYVDDVYLGYDDSFVLGTEKKDFEDTSDFGFAGFTMNNSFAATTTWSAGNKDGNTYMVHKNGTAEPLTWLDSMNLMDQGEFAVSFDYRYDSTKSGGGLLSVKLDRASAADKQEFRIIHQNDGVLTFGPATNTGAGLNIARITTPKSAGGAQWHTIKTVFKPYISEGRIDMLYEFYVDGKLSAYTDMIEGVDENGNTTYSYNFYTNYSGTWTAKTNLQPAKMVQYIKSGDTNGNGKADADETVTYGTKWDATKCTWGNDTNNCPRVPMGYWDGYYKEYIDGVGTSGMAESDGKIGTIWALYMFHFNSHGFSVDNLAIEVPVEKKPVEGAELFGYQLGKDGTSVRFIAGVDSLDFGQIGMDVEVYEQPRAVGWLTKVNAKMSNSIYTVLTADGEQVTAREEIGTRFFTMLSVLDIDSSAIVRVSPYTTKAGVRTYGDPVIYAIQFVDGAITVTPATVHVNDFDDGVAKGTTSDGYAKSTYAQLIAPTGDWGSGGEGGSRSVVGEDGTMKITVASNYYYDHSTTNQTEMKKWFYTYTTETVDEETGETTTTLHTVKDADGKTIDKRGSMSARYKIAHVIPYDYSTLIGNTLIVSAKVKVAEIRKIVNVDVEGYAGEITEENKATYSKPVTVVDNSIKANVTFSLFEDVTYSAKGSADLGTIKSYSLSVSDEWVEMVIAVDITENYAKDLALSQKNGEYVPIRPTISLGNADGWASVLYVNDVTCSIVPTLK